VKLNLRKARKLESKIQKHLQETIYVNKDMNLTVRVKSKSTDVLQAIAAKKDIVIADFATREKLLDIRFAIRGLISAANADQGIDALMTKKALLENKAKDIQDRASHIQPALPKELLEDELEAHKKAKPSEYGDVQTTFRTNVVPEEELEKLADKVADIRREIEDVDDKLSEKNLSAKVDIAEGDTKLLKQLRLF